VKIKYVLTVFALFVAALGALYFHFLSVVDSDGNAIKKVFNNNIFYI